MKKFTNVIRWIGVAVFGIMAIASLGSGGFLGALLFLLGGLIIAPLGFVQKLRGKLKLNKALSIVLAVVLLFGGSLATPTSEVPTDDTGSSQIVGTVSDDTSETDKTTNSSTPSTSESTSKTEDTSSKEETTSKPESSSKTETTSKPETTSKTETTACSHAQTTVKNKANATCTENGYTGDTYCNACNKVVKTGSQINATGHSTEIRNKKSATTTSEGYTGDTYCKTCGVKTATGKVIPKIEDNTQQNNNSQIVYVTETGKKYHSTKNCSGLNNANAIYDSTLSEAQGRGLTPCSKCH